MWINPNDSNHILVVNDGGIAISRDGLATFKHPVNLPIGHLFSIAVSQTKGTFWAYSNIQDTGGWRGQIDMTAGRDKITSKEWESAAGDEAGRHAVHPTNPDIVYFVTRYGGGPSMIDYKVAAARGTAGAAAGRSGRTGTASGGRSRPDRSAARGRPGRGGATGRPRWADDHRPGLRDREEARTVGVATHHLPARFQPPALRRAVRVPDRRSGQDVEEDQPRPDQLRHGQAGEHRVFHCLVDLRVTAEEGADLRGNR
jgi:hypothetical protein